MKSKIFIFITLILISNIFFTNCKQITETTEEITQINYIVPVWKGSLPEAPSNPEIGWAYYNTTVKKSFIYDGKSWQIMAQDGKDGIDGIGIIWKGELSSAPSSPKTNWAYYNTIDGNSYIYNGSSWDYLARAGRDGSSGILLWLGSYDNAPENPNEGWAYHNSTTGTSYIYSNGEWQLLAQDGNGIIWKWALSVPPENPELNWAFYNTTTQVSYIWNGTSWDTLAASLGGDTTVTVPINWLGTFDSAPLSPQIGAAYYNCTVGASYIYDGNVWQQISKDGMDGTNNTTTTVGYLITWKGSSSSAPANPSAGWAYYNTSSKKSYIYDGSRWQVIAQDGADGANGTGSGSSSSNAEIKIYADNSECTYYQFGTLDFGNTSSFVTFTIKNTGSSTLKLTDSNIYEYMGGLYDYKDQFVIDVSDTSSTIEPGKTTTFKVKYAPTKASSNISTTIYIPSNAKNGNCYFYFYGSCKAPDLYILLQVNGTQYLAYPYLNDLNNNNQYVIETVDFGTTYANTPVNSTSFTIQNVGANNAGTTLRLTKNISITGTDASSFSVVQPDSTTIAPNKNVTAKLTFNPTSIGRKTATVTVYTNAPGRESYTFTVIGNCIASSGTGSEDPGTTEPEQPAPKWPKYFDGGEGDGNDVIMCSAHDSLGNLYFAGYGYELVNNHSGYDWWIKKFTKDGDEITTGWNKKISYYDDYTKKYDIPGKILIDGSDDVIILSKYNAAKFSSNGTLLWEKNENYGNYKTAYIDKNNNTYLVTNKETFKISNTGTVDWSINDTAPLVFDTNDNFATYKNSKITYYSSNANIIKEFRCIDESIETVDSNGWLNSEIKSETENQWFFPVTSGKSYAIQMNNQNEGNSTKTGTVYLKANYLSTNTQIFSKDYSMYVSPNTFTASSDDTVCIESTSYGSSYYGDYAFRVMIASGKDITTGWSSGSVSTSATEKKFTYNVEEGKTYIILVNDKTNGNNSKTGRIKVSAEYSDGTSILSSSSSNYWKTGKIFVASKTDTVTLTATIYSSSTSYAGTFAVSLTEPPVISSFESKKSIEVNSICFDSNNDIYVAGSSINKIDNFSEKDVRIKKYSSNGEPYSGWDYSFDWGHCDDEYATSIIFDGNRLQIYGIGNDLISGSSKSDMWFKTLSTTGSVLSEVVVDDTANNLLTVDNNNSIYLSNGYYLYKYSATGVLEKTINPAGAAPYMSYESNPFGNYGLPYTVNIDGKIYAAGYSQNAVTSVSGYDWCIKQY